MQTIKTPEDHIQLLLEKGYLGQNQKNDWQLGYWCREFTQQYDICRAQALENNRQTRFMMKLIARFNEQLITINFTFRYKYDPVSDSLALASLYAAFGPARKTYYPPRSEDLVPANAVYELLSRADSLHDNKTFFRNLKTQFESQRDPDNDYSPDTAFQDRSK